MLVDTFTSYIPYIRRFQRKNCLCFLLVLRLKGKSVLVGIPSMLQEVLGLQRDLFLLSHIQDGH